MKRIYLSQGQYTLVDDADFNALIKFSWHYKNGYAARSVGPKNEQKRIWMHHVIAGSDLALSVDHKDRNGLNNQRSNLRVVSRSIQGLNRKMPARKYPRGVSFHNGKFQSTIRVKGKLLYLGRHETAEAASLAYKLAALEHFGEVPPE